jgi:hypothetical protein
MAGYKVGYFVGSLATKSINRFARKAPADSQQKSARSSRVSWSEMTKQTAERYR